MIAAFLKRFGGLAEFYNDQENDYFAKEIISQKFKWKDL